MSGAKVELGLARGRPALTVTTREHRAPRGVTADSEGKALKAEILRTDVARNKATRPRRAQTAERVRNSESGRCR
jgi:ribosomal protein S1